MQPPPSVRPPPPAAPASDSPPPIAAAFLFVGSFASGQALQVAHAAPPPDPFWQAWSDGKAEVAGYSLQQPRYGQLRDGTLVLIFVTEDFSDSVRVKADPGKHPPQDVYPVLKLNAMRRFQTGVYEYSTMTSVFVRIDGLTRAGTPASTQALRKVSFSAQEWCGHVYHQVIPEYQTVAAPLGPGRASPLSLSTLGPDSLLLRSLSHSYFDGEADRQESLLVVGPTLSEDELPLRLRPYVGRPALLEPGATRTFSFLPSLQRLRLQHQPLVAGQVTIHRQATPQPLVLPSGSFEATVYDVQIKDGPKGTYSFESAPPHRLLHYRLDTGEEASLRRSTRLAYWQLNHNGEQSYLEQLGLRPPPTAAP